MEWKKVCEELPEIGQEVLVCYSYEVTKYKEEKCLSCECVKNIPYISQHVSFNVASTKNTAFGIKWYNNSSEIMEPVYWAKIDLPSF